MLTWFEKLVGFFNNLIGYFVLQQQFKCMEIGCSGWVGLLCANFSIFWFFDFFDDMRFLSINKHF